jgi:hypothetical protein
MKTNQIGNPKILTMKRKINPEEEAMSVFIKSV